MINMINANRFITALVLSVTCFFGTSMGQTVSKEFSFGLNVPPIQYLGSTHFAQNDQKNSSDKVSSENVPKTQKNASTPKTSTPEKNSSEKRKPVKPFVPSETIPADQGVDFPYDI